ncbi:MAG: DeoR family transcriptional regulator [Patescibacteria group bacterium]|nr:DeoR family transcriptional regulator [Patescibacteria group bacterium]
MNERQKQLLNLVIESHITTAEPIGSRFLISEAGLDWSEATIRNDLRALEEEGYLTHPHTSAGRVPTEKGYRFYLKNLDLAKAKISKKDNDVLGMSLKEATDPELQYKHLARTLAELSGETVFFAPSPNKVYFAGLSNLFAKPEFRALELVADLSQILDHCDQCLNQFFEDDGFYDMPKFLLGKEHDFGNMLAALAFNRDEGSLLVMIGPMRMDYSRNYALMNRVKELM